MFASIFDQLINTAIILDMMFNTEMIVKDMKGGKEDMTETKRFILADIGFVYDNEKLIGMKDIVEVMNALYDENQLLHKINEDTIDFMYDNFDLNIIFTDRELNDICNEMGWELSEKGIKIKQLEKEKEQLRKENDMFSCELSVSANKEISRNCRIAELEEENEQLKKRIAHLKNELAYKDQHNTEKF